MLFICLLIFTASARALVIVPTFDSTISSDTNAATIEATINTAVQFYEARFSDPITVTIYFQEITNAGYFGTSGWSYYNTPYSTYRTNLIKDATTTNDTLANTYLPAGTNNPVTGTTTVRVKSANLRAIGISASGGMYDGTIGLHTSQLNLSRATNNPSKGDLLATVEHEIDEVLGLGSALDENASDPFPQDLFRYTSNLSRTFTTNGDDAYFSLDGTNLLARFNQDTNYDRGDWWYVGAHTPQVQDAVATDGTQPNPKTELIALDVIGYNLLPVPQPVITKITIAGPQLMINATNGLASAGYVVLTSTNISTPLNQWLPLTTNLLNTNGNFSITVPNAVNASETKRFYCLQVQL